MPNKIKKQRLFHVLLGYINEDWSLYVSLFTEKHTHVHSCKDEATLWSDKDRPGRRQEEQVTQKEREALDLKTKFSSCFSAGNIKWQEDL